MTRGGCRVGWMIGGWWVVTERERQAEGSETRRQRGGGRFEMEVVV